MPYIPEVNQLCHDSLSPVQTITNNRCSLFVKIYRERKDLPQQDFAPLDTPRPCQLEGAQASQS